MSDKVIDGILEHNHDAAAMWGAGGKGYDDVSFAISDALAHAAQRLGAKPGDRALDIATGTGWSARNLARMGVHVTAIDFSPELVAAAKALSTGANPPIDFRVADAENLPFADGSFDEVISTFGIMFAGDHERAAGELGRVCRKGARVSVATWPPDGAVARFFGVIAEHARAPRPRRSPLLWGDPRYLQALLGTEFVLAFEKGRSNAYHSSVEAVWQGYVRGFGPLRALYESLGEAQREALKRDIDDYHAQYVVEAGVRIEREYLLVIAERR